MGLIKENTVGHLNLEFTVDPAFGLLDRGHSVQHSLTQPYTVVPLGEVGLPLSIGYVTIPNKKIGGKCVVATNGRALEENTVSFGEAFLPPGSPVHKLTSGDVIAAKFVRGIGSLTVNNSPWPGGEKIFIGSGSITEGIHFSSGGTNDITAKEIAKAINLHIPLVMAKVAGAGIAVEATDVWRGIISMSSDADPANLTVGPDIPTGTFSAMWPYGLGLTDSVAGGPIDVLVF